MCEYYYALFFFTSATTFTNSFFGLKNVNVDTCYMYPAITLQIKTLTLPYLRILRLQKQCKGRRYEINKKNDDASESNDCSWKHTFGKSEMRKCYSHASTTCKIYSDQDSRNYFGLFVFSLRMN